MPKKSTKKIKIFQERKFSSHFLDLRKIVPEKQEFEKPKRRGFFSLKKWNKVDPPSPKLRKTKIRVNFITPGEKRVLREREELEFNKKINRYSRFLSDQRRQIKKASAGSRGLSFVRFFRKMPKLNKIKVFSEASLSRENTPPTLFKRGELEKLWARTSGMEQRRMPSSGMTRRWKSMIYFILTCLIFVLSLQTFSLFQELKNKKQVILAMSLEAYENLSSGEFSKAEQEFSEAQKKLNQFGFLNYIIPHLPQARHILKAGEIMAEIGEEIGKLGNWEIEKTKDYLLKIAEVYPKIKSVDSHLSKVNVKYLPEEYKESFLENKKKIEVLSSGLKSLVNYIPYLSKILGFKETQHYLIIFQNNNEIRPTGGFMGSLAFLDVYQGKIKNLEIPYGGPYDFRKFLKSNVAPPKPLRRINYQWQLQDANWFPDFPTSAEKILWFLRNTNFECHPGAKRTEQSGVSEAIGSRSYCSDDFNGLEFDGVIAINASVVPEILKIIGPIEMSEYGRVITPENFVSETQQIVGLESDKKKAKEFIADLVPVVLDKILGENNGIASVAPSGRSIAMTMEILINALDQKEIQVFFTDKKLENKIKDLGWAGEIKDSPPAFAKGINDYLMLINTNIGGRKTDEVIKEKIHHQAEIQKDGSIINQVTITRTHQGQKGNYFTGVRNDNYLRIYVPQGSQLLEVSGDFIIPTPGNFRAVTQGAVADKDLIRIEKNARIDEVSGTRITQEFDRTCFANWIQIEPGETATVVFKYKLPFKINLENFETKLYSLVWQKQSGTRAEIESQLILPENYQTIWEYPENLVLQSNGTVKFSSILNKDKLWAVKIGTKENNKK